jgi:hypothetical protein
VPRQGTASAKNLSQRPTEAPSRPVTPDWRKADLEVSSIDGLMLSDGKVAENAHTAADLIAFSASAWISRLGPELAILWPSRAADSPGVTPACLAGMWVTAGRSMGLR